MAKNLQVDNTLSSNTQPIKDQDGNASVLSLSISAVGIGTNNPGAKVEINDGDLLFKASAENPGKVLFHNSAGEQKGRIWSNPSAGSGLFFSSRDTAPDISISPSGNVGIGTSVPNAKLEINNGDLLFKASAEDPGDIVFQNSSGVQKARIFSNPELGAGLFLSSGFNPHDVVISSSGNVGIGTPMPNKKLSVAGDMEVLGDIILLNADCAEDFDICESDLAEPGTVMVLGKDGKLVQSQKAYDKRVVGVISGAGCYKPGIILDKQETGNTRKPIALLGKVFCKVDAGFGTIEVGDLLTTAPIPGHAMKASDPLKAFGSVIGKALKPKKEGQGLIPVLISLQ